jgi:hypothetical protein
MAIFKKVTIEVPCSGETHRIEIDENYQAKLLDHDEAMVDMTQAFESFGAEPHPASCFRLLHWYQTDPWWFVTKLAPYPGDATFIECVNEDCGWSSDDIFAVRLRDVDDLAERIDPGELVPAGECPKCGWLVYLGREVKK